MPWRLPRDSSPTGRPIRCGVNSLPQSPARISTTAPGPIGSSQAGPKARGSVIARLPLLNKVTRLLTTSCSRDASISSKSSTSPVVSWPRAVTRVRGPSSVKSTPPRGQTSRAPTSAPPWSTIRSAPRTCLVPKADSPEGSRSGGVSKLCWSRGAQVRTSPSVQSCSTGPASSAARSTTYRAVAVGSIQLTCWRRPGVRRRSAVGTRKTRSWSARPRSRLQRRRRSMRWCSHPAG